MSSRDKILNAIKKNKPAETPLPETFTVSGGGQDLTARYLDVLQSIGGKGTVVSGLAEAEALLQEKRQSGETVVNCCRQLSGYNADAFLTITNEEAEAVDTVFLNGVVAVAENAAVWVTEAEMANRMLPFICQQLVILVEEKNLVATMHDAYERINVADTGFGTFIAGPSKTADIEQSLVIGAHGPLALQVYLTPSPSPAEL